MRLWNDRSSLLREVVSLEVGMMGLGASISPFFYWENSELLSQLSAKQAKREKERISPAIHINPSSDVSYSSCFTGVENEAQMASITSPRHPVEGWRSLLQTHVVSQSEVLKLGGDQNHPPGLSKHKKLDPGLIQEAWASISLLGLWVILIHCKFCKTPF